MICKMACAGHFGQVWVQVHEQIPEMIAVFREPVARPGGVKHPVVPASGGALRMCPRGLDIDKLPKVVCPQKLNQICPGRMKPSGDIDHEDLAVEGFDFRQQGEKLVVRESDWFFGQDMFAGIDCGLDLRGVEVGRRCYDQSVNIFGLNEFRLIGL